MSLTHWRAPAGTVREMNLSAGRRLRPRGTPPLVIKQNATECVQPVHHYYRACALNVSRRRRDDSIDLNQSAIYIRANPLTSDYKSTRLHTVAGLLPIC